MSINVYLHKAKKSGGFTHRDHGEIRIWSPRPVHTQYCKPKGKFASLENLDEAGKKIDLKHHPVF